MWSSLNILHTMKRKSSEHFVQAEGEGLSSLVSPAMAFLGLKVQIYSDVCQRCSVLLRSLMLRQLKINWDSIAVSSTQRETGSNSVLWLVLKFFLTSEKASHLIFPQLSYASLQNLFQHEVLPIIIFLDILELICNILGKMI